MGIFYYSEVEPVVVLCKGCHYLEHVKGEEGEKDIHQKEVQRKVGNKDVQEQKDMQ